MSSRRNPRNGQRRERPPKEPNPTRPRGWRRNRASERRISRRVAYRKRVLDRAPQIQADITDAQRRGLIGLLDGKAPPKQTLVVLERLSLTNHGTLTQLGRAVAKAGEVA